MEQVLGGTWKKKISRMWYKYNPHFSKKNTDEDEPVHSLALPAISGAGPVGAPAGLW